MSSFQPAPQLIFLDWTVAGHYGNLRIMKARTPTWKIIEGYVNRFEGEFSARPEPEA